MINEFIEKVIKGGTCTGCGLCVGLDYSNKSYMLDTKNGPIPVIDKNAVISKNIEKACPGYKLNYPELYLKHYSKYPNNWLVGIIDNVYIGYSNKDNIRKNAASGGIISHVLVYMVENKLVDGVIVAKQGLPTPEKARSVIVNSKEEVLDTAQSVYIPVSMLDTLNQTKQGETYAITCLPDQAAALRKMQIEGDERALRIKYVLGPYTGTAIKPQAISYFLKGRGISKRDKIVSLKWRAGEWPGYLEIKMSSGKVLQSKKIYYNFLIPFFVTNTSLQNMDFTNEFADLAVGDAWSPEFEKQGQGFSVVVSRNKEIDSLLNKMREEGLINLEKKDLSVASQMHGHMIDFKKRGSYIRNKMRKIVGKKAPDFGYSPKIISFSRVLVELVISTIFWFGKTWMFRQILIIIPESILGNVFNKLRLKWKNISKPVKRKSLGNYKVNIN